MNISAGQIIFLLIWGILIVVLPLKFAKKDAQKGQMIATGMGILGTFLGITYGLWNFDTDNIEMAVPELLGGMRFAFLTSIIGMGFSLAIGMIPKKLGFQDEELVEQPQTDQDLLTSMLQILQESKEESKVQREEMKKAFFDLARYTIEHDKSEDMAQELKTISNNIAGEDDQSLVSQMRKLKNVINEKQDELINVTNNLSKEDTQNNLVNEMKYLHKDIVGEGETSLSGRLESLENLTREKQDELKTSFDNFAQQMAENNMEALVQAVQKVMEDFNTQINDKLGESFNNLNDGVKRLLEWQDQNKEQMGSNIEMLRESKDAITSSAEVLNTANNAIGDISGRMDTLTKNAESFDKTATELGEALKTMGDVMVGMNNLAEELSGNGETITEEMRSIVKSSIEELGNNLKGISEAMANDYEAMQQTISRIANNH